MKEKKKISKKDNENILDESIELNVEGEEDKIKLAQKATTIIKKNSILYDGVECELSLYLFKKENWFRKFLYKMTVWKGFETILFVVIILSSFKLVMDTYYIDAPKDSTIV